MDISKHASPKTSWPECAILFYGPEHSCYAKWVRHVGRLTYDMKYTHCSLWLHSMDFSFTWEGACYQLDRYPENVALSVPIQGVDRQFVIHRFNQWAFSCARLRLIDLWAKFIFDKAHGPLCTDFVLALLGIDHLSLTPGELLLWLNILRLTSPVLTATHLMLSACTLMDIRSVSPAERLTALLAKLDLPYPICPQLS